MPASSAPVLFSLRGRAGARGLVQLIRRRSGWEPCRVERRLGSSVPRAAGPSSLQATGGRPGGCVVVAERVHELFDDLLDPPLPHGDGDGFRDGGGVPDGLPAPATPRWRRPASSLRCTGIFLDRAYDDVQVTSGRIRPSGARGAGLRCLRTPAEIWPNASGRLFWTESSRRWRPPRTRHNGAGGTLGGIRPPGRAAT